MTISRLSTIGTRLAICLAVLGLIPVLLAQDDPSSAQKLPFLTRLQEGLQETKEKLADKIEGPLEVEALGIDELPTPPLPEQKPVQEQSSAVVAVPAQEQPPGEARITDVVAVPAEPAVDLQEAYEEPTVVPQEVYETPAVVEAFDEGVRDTLQEIEREVLTLHRRTHRRIFNPQPEDLAGEARLSDWGHKHSQHFLARNRYQSQVIGDWFYDELGLYDPSSGAGGRGVPPFGMYQRVYPVNPLYTHPQDTRLYGTQAAGIPIAIPLAPTVGSAYNYSTGIPSSRLTNISAYGR